jgi:hypothetical protein
MVVDVVASAARNYDRVEQSIVPGFERLVSNARNEGPECLAEAGVEGLGLV